MVQIRKMRMAVHERLVPVPVRMRFACRNVRVMLMLVMFIVHVGMFVLQWLVGVQVLMSLGEMQVYPQPHQAPGREQLPGHGLRKKRHPKRRANEGRRRKVCARTRRSQVAKREHEQYEAHAVAQQTNNAGANQWERRR